MSKYRLLRLFFYLNLLLIALVLAYKIYLDFFKQDFHAVHARQVELIQASLAGRDGYNFAVIGNVNNSILTFERKIIPLLNASGVDFIVSAGNAVSNGGEDKYRAIYQTLGRLDMPYLLTIGQHEASNFGSFRFYEHFGPYYHAFSAGSTRFYFLDSTGNTSYAWQLRWLEEDLSRADVTHVFLFLAHPVQTHPGGLTYREFREALVDLSNRYNIDAVFTTDMAFFRHRRRENRDLMPVAADGGMFNSDIGLDYFLTVSVAGEAVDIDAIRIESAPNRLLQWLEELWFSIHSFFYVSYLNFLLIIAGLVALAVRLYMVIFLDKDYYPDFDLDPGPWLDKPLKVAMFTNNYLPFIGGVPISIERLCRGLKGLGRRVIIVAPEYKGTAVNEEDVLRVPSLLSFGSSKREFRLGNIFTARIRRALREFRPDVIHVHHPFWLGSLGLFLARRYRVPAIYTYHTRLEHYAHFVPLPGPLFRNLISHYFIRRFANKCDGVIVPTYSSEEYLRLIGVKRDIFIQPTGIEYDRFQRVGADEVDALRGECDIETGDSVLVSVSRLSREKNIDFIIDAMEALRREQVGPWRLLLIGDGMERERLQARLGESGLAGRVTLVGSVPPERIPVFYSLGDIFLFASKSETQGMVILEAMAAGLPAVTVRSSGVDDVVQDGVNGYKTREKVSDWCARLRLLMEDEALRRRLGDNARRCARDYDLEKVARNVIGIYAHVLAAREEAESEKITVAGRQAD